MTASNDSKTIPKETEFHNELTKQYFVSVNEITFCKAEVLELRSLFQPFCMHILDDATWADAL